MTRIDSPHNPRLRSLRRLARRSERERSGRFVAEGEDLIAAARAAERHPLEGFCRAGAAVGEPGFHEVGPAALKSVSALASGSRVLAVYEQQWDAPHGPLCVYLHGVGDPGNVGTVLRSAHAFGASCVALGPGCADPHSPKAVRASMGAIFSLALARVDDVASLPGERVALVAGAGASPLPVALRGLAAEGIGCTLLVGAEREGLPAEIVAACERSAHITVAGDSLNAAMAATVALYELSREAPPKPSGGRSDAPAKRSSRVRAA